MAELSEKNKELTEKLAEIEKYSLSECGKAESKSIFYPCDREKNKSCKCGKHDCMNCFSTDNKQLAKIIGFTAFEWEKIEAVLGEDTFNKRINNKT
jgi:hypothetical protein